MLIVILSLLSLIILMFTGIFKHNFNAKSLNISFISLVIGGLLLLFISTKHININQQSSLYSDPNRPIPLSVTLMSNAQVTYKYDSKYIKMGKHAGQTVFTIKAASLPKKTTLQVTQKYRNMFLVNTVETKDINILRKV